MRRRKAVWGRAVPLALVAAATVVAAVEPAESQAPRHVVLVGDSLAWEAGEAFRYAAGTAGWRTTELTAGGTAPCDFLPALVELATREPIDRVIVSFSGNALTPCIAGASGAALLLRYEADLWAMRQVVPKARFVLAGQPSTQGRPEIDALDRRYRQLAKRWRAGFVDAGAAVESRGLFTSTLRCRTGPGCVDGVMTVRGPDGLHFCPQPAPPAPPPAPTVDASVASTAALVETTDATVPASSPLAAAPTAAPRCPVPSPGALRFGVALANGVRA